MGLSDKGPTLTIYLTNTPVRRAASAVLLGCYTAILIMALLTISPLPPPCYQMQTEQVRINRWTVSQSQSVPELTGSAQSAAQVLSGNMPRAPLVDWVSSEAASAQRRPEAASARCISFSSLFL